MELETLELQLQLPSNNDNASLQPTISSAKVLPSNHFGMGDQTSSEYSALLVEYDNQNAPAIPEPSSLGIIGASLIGGYAIGRFWHRRQLKKDA
jgi:hypothetical protein